MSWGYNGAAQVVGKIYKQNTVGNESEKLWEIVMLCKKYPLCGGTGSGEMTSEEQVVGKIKLAI